MPGSISMPEPAAGACIASFRSPGANQNANICAESLTAVENRWSSKLRQEASPLSLLPPRSRSVKEGNIMILDSFRQDVRVGLRVLFKEKSFCILAVLVLCLGIGGATTQFTVVNAIVLRGFSFPHPEQLVSVGLIDPKASDQNNNFGNGNIPAAQDYEDIRAAQKSFLMMAGYLNGSTINVTYNHNPQRYTGAYITDELFRIVGVSPVLGRDFTAEDNKPGSGKTAILGDKIWRRDFNADPNIVGQSVTINGKEATIIGVMPAGFEFPT